MLRDYQQRAISDLRAVYARGRRAPCLVIPTGGGKTIIAAEIIRSAIARGRRVLFLAHRTELLEQSVLKLDAAGVSDVRMIQAARDLGRPDAPVTVASVPTMARRSTEIPADLVVFDEAHHVVAKTWKQIADRYRHAAILGLTATPQRSDGSPLGDVFDALVVGATVRELTELGHLAPCRVWAPPNALESGELAVSPIDAYLEHGEGQRAVVFCATVEHAQEIASSMVARGVATEVVHGGLAAASRSDVLKRFRAGVVRAVCNVHVLTEGWDDPACSVCILARKPQHAGTYLQMVGRVLRPADGKQQAKLLDLGGVSLIHGTPDMDRSYSLDGKAISGAEREAIRQCPSCGAVFRSEEVAEDHSSTCAPDCKAKHCPQCLTALPYRAIEAPRAIGVGLSEVKDRTDQLRLNLLAAARRGRHSAAWVERAYAAIGARR